MTPSLNEKWSSKPVAGSYGGIGNSSTNPRKGAYDAAVQSTSGIKRITCVCGKVLEGKDDDELWAAQAHVAADHPDLVGKVSREDILARAEEI